MWNRQRRERLIGGHYRVTRELGIGATGTVLAATDLRSGSQVAIKVLHPHLMKDSRFRRSFREELELAVLVRSPSVVRVIEVGEDQGLSWIVMEYVGGGTLRRLLKQRRRLPENEALCVSLDVATALEVSHRSGVTHGDVKPENILLDLSGRAYLTDFSIARIQVASGQTAIGTAGSIEYMAPESFGGRSDARSDVYSFGVVLFEMLSGETPFHAEDPWQVARNHRELAAPDLAAAPDSIRAELAKTAGRCLSKAPEDRYQNGAELAASLGEICRSHSIEETDLRIGRPGLLTLAYRSVLETVPTSIVGSKRALVGATAAALVLGASASASVVYWPGDEGSPADTLSAGRPPATRASGVLANAERPSATSTRVSSPSPTPSRAAVASQTPRQGVALTASDSPTPAAFIDSTTPTGPIAPPTPDTPTRSPSETATATPSVTRTPTQTPTFTPSPTSSACPPVGSSIQGVGTWCGSMPGPITGQTDFAVSLLLFDAIYGRTDISADVSTPNRESSLVFRAQDDGNGYQLIYQPNGLPFRNYDVGGMWLYRRQDYQGHFLAYAPVTAGPAEVARVRVLADGSAIRVWLDGALLIDVMDDAITSGHAGFRVVGDVNWPCDATFSNINVVGDPP